MDSIKVYPPTDLDTWAQVAQIIIAAFTIILAVIAIWGNAIRRRLLPPHLVLSKRNFEGDFNERTMHDGKLTRTIYYHLKLVNTHGSPAVKVRVLCEAVSRMKADGSFKEEPLVIPMQLCWSFIRFQELLPTIGPDRYVDIGWLAEGEDRFIIALLATPGNFKGFVHKDETLRFMIVATADNLVRSKPLYLQISWDGKFVFDKDEMSKHLVIKEVTSLG